MVITMWKNRPNKLPLTALGKEMHYNSQLLKDMKYVAFVFSGSLTFSKMCISE